MGEPFSVTANSLIPHENLPDNWDEMTDDEKWVFILEYEPPE